MVAPFVPVSLLLVMAFIHIVVGFSVDDPVYKGCWRHEPCTRQRDPREFSTTGAFQYGLGSVPVPIDKPNSKPELPHLERVDDISPD